MEELEQAIKVLQKKFKDLDATDNSIKNVINSHSKNWKMLENFNEQLNERVSALEAKIESIKKPKDVFNDECMD